MAYVHGQRLATAAEPCTLLLRLAPARHATGVLARPAGLPGSVSETGKAGFGLPNLKNYCYFPPIQQPVADVVACELHLRAKPMVSELVSQRPFATEAGTARFVQRHGAVRHAESYRHVGHLHLSTLGIGTYLGAADDQTDAAYREAIVDAVRRGVNIIDTASNYRNQRSERVVGQALGDLTQAGTIYRSEVLVASKVGFVSLPCTPEGDPRALLHAQTIGRGLCQPDELVAHCHCISADYITATLQQSRSNLGLETLDVYYIHNPETQLQFLERQVVEDRLRQAFVALEAAADRGEIRVYGLATWSALRARPEERDWLSLQRIVQLAEEVAGPRHRMRAVQLPLSLTMPEAVIRNNQPVGNEWVSAIEAAQRLGLVVFASGSLQQGRLSRNCTLPYELIQVPSHMSQPAARALQFARSVQGVTSAVVGMAQTAHVVDNLQLLDHPRADSAWLQAVIAHTQSRGCA